jgi:hypothetical protein
MENNSNLELGDLFLDISNPIKHDRIVNFLRSKGFELSGVGRGVKHLKTLRFMNMCWYSTIDKPKHGIRDLKSLLNSKSDDEIKKYYIRNF